MSHASPARVAFGPFAASSARVDGVASSSAPAAWTRLGQDATSILIPNLAPAPIKGMRGVVKALFGMETDDSTAKIVLRPDLLRPTVVSSLESGALSVFELLVRAYLLKAANTFKKKGIDGNKFLTLRHDEIRDLLKGEPTDEDAVYRLVVLVTRLRRCQAQPTTYIVTDIDPTVHEWTSPVPLDSLPASVRWRWCTEVGVRVRMFDHKGFWQTLAQMDRETRVPYADCHELIPLVSHCKTITALSCAQVAEFLSKNRASAARPIFHESGIDGAALAMLTPARLEELFTQTDLDPYKFTRFIFTAIDCMRFMGDPTPCPRIQPTDDSHRYPVPGTTSTIIWRWRRWSTGEVTPVREYSLRLPHANSAVEPTVWVALDQMVSRQRAECEKDYRNLPPWVEPAFKVHLPSSAAAIQCLRQCFGSQPPANVPAGEQFVLESSPLDDQTICVRWRDTPGKPREFFIRATKGRYEWTTIANMTKNVRGAFEQLRITEAAPPSSKAATAAPPKAAAATSSASSGTTAIDRPAGFLGSLMATADTILYVTQCAADIPHPAGDATYLQFKLANMPGTTGVGTAGIYTRRVAGRAREFLLRTTPTAVAPTWMTLTQMPSQLRDAVEKVGAANFKQIDEEADEDRAGASGSTTAADDAKKKNKKTAETSASAAASSSQSSTESTTRSFEDLAAALQSNPSTASSEAGLPDENDILYFFQCAQDIPPPPPSSGTVLVYFHELRPALNGLYTRRGSDGAPEYLLRATPTAIAPTWMKVDSMTKRLRRLFELLGFKDAAEDALGRNEQPNSSATRPATRAPTAPTVIRADERRILFASDTDLFASLTNPLVPTHGDDVDTEKEEEEDEEDAAVARANQPVTGKKKKKKKKKKTSVTSAAASAPATSTTSSTSSQLTSSSLEAMAHETREFLSDPNALAAFDLFGVYAQARTLGYLDSTMVDYIVSTTTDRKAFDAALLHLCTSPVTAPTPTDSEASVGRTESVSIPTGRKDPAILYTRQPPDRRREFYMRTYLAASPAWLSRDQLPTELATALQRFYTSTVMNTNTSASATQGNALATGPTPLTGQAATNAPRASEMKVSITSKGPAAGEVVVDLSDAVLLERCTTGFAAPRQTAAETAVARLESLCISTDVVRKPIVLYSRKTPNRPREFYLQPPDATTPAWMNVDQMPVGVATAICKSYTMAAAGASRTDTATSSQKTSADVPPLIPIFYTLKSHPVNTLQASNSSASSDKSAPVPTEQEWCDYILKEEMVENDGPARHSSAAVARDVDRVTAAELESAPNDAPLPTILRQLQSNDEREQLRGVRALSAVHSRPAFRTIASNKTEQQKFLSAIVGIVDRTKNTEARCAAINLCKLLTMVIPTPPVLQSMVKLGLLPALIRFIKTSDFTVDLSRAKRSAWIIITNIAKSSYTGRSAVIGAGAISALATCDVHPLLMPRTMANLLLALAGNSIARAFESQHYLQLVPVIERILHTTDPRTLDTVVRVLLVMLNDAKRYMSAKAYAALTEKCVEQEMMARLFMLLDPHGGLKSSSQHVVLECCMHFADVYESDGNTALSVAHISRFTTLMLHDKSLVSLFTNPSLLAHIERIAVEAQRVVDSNASDVVVLSLLSLSKQLDDAQFCLYVNERFLGLISSLLMRLSSSLPEAAVLEGLCMFDRAFRLGVAEPNCHLPVFLQHVATEHSGQDIPDFAQAMTTTIKTTCTCSDGKHA